MPGESAYQHQLIDQSHPQPSRTLMDWAALYPTLPLTAVVAALSEARKTASSQRMVGGRATMIVTWLVAARLQELTAQLRGDDADFAGSEMDVAAAELSINLADRNRRHINDVSEAVFVSHAGQPADVVLAVLMRKAATAIFEPKPEVMEPAAQAISTGRRFVFV